MSDAPRLEVVVRGERDVPGAIEGGADRLMVVAEGDLCVEPAVVTAVCRAADGVPVRAMLRLSDGWTTTGGELARLVALGQDYAARGAEGLAYGFLDRDLELDREICDHVTDALGALPWTFHRAVDASLAPRRTLRAVAGLSSVTAVWSAGSPRGLAAGLEELLTAVREVPGLAEVLMPGGDLRAEQVPWLMRAGVRQYHLGPEARPGGSERAYVDAGLVRSFRLLLDDLHRGA